MKREVFGALELSSRPSASSSPTPRRSRSPRWPTGSSIPSGSSGCTSSTPSRSSRSSRWCGRLRRTMWRSRPRGTSTASSASARAREGRAGVRRQPAADAPVDGAHAGDRERHDVRGDGRGGAAARDPDAPSVLLAMVGPRVANHVLARSTTPSPTGSPSRRRSRRWPTASFPRSRRRTAARASTRSTSAFSRHSPTRHGTSSTRASSRARPRSTRA